MGSEGPKSYFLMGAGVMLAGFVAGSIFKSFTIDNARNAVLFVDELKERRSGSGRPVIVPAPPQQESQDVFEEYPDFYSREAPPPVPPSEEYPKRVPVPIAISMEDEDFYEKINEEALAGRSLVSDWADA